MSSSSLISSDVMDTTLIDAFGRLRISEPVTLFDSKQLFDNLPLLFDDAETKGSGTSSEWKSQLASSTLLVSDRTTGTRVRQTKRRFNYQPGRSLLVIASGVLGEDARGITRRIGYFDDDNGLFFELSDSVLSVVRRSSETGSPIDYAVHQDQWNRNKLNGQDFSSIVIDPALAQVFFIDMEWLGVGRVRFGVFINGHAVVCHEMLHANALSNVYMSTPNLPIRFEIANDGTGQQSTMQHVCAAVISEGATDRNFGVVYSIDRGTHYFRIPPTLNECVPLLSVRLKSDHLGSTITPLSISVMSSPTAQFLWKLILNPIFSGGDIPSWDNLPNSAIEYDIHRSLDSRLAGGTVIASGYADGCETADLPDHNLKLGSKIDGARDELVLVAEPCAQNIVKGYLAGLTFQEFS